tara:strand:+ start:398 stop:532 length:135 start_codon:yes stop_codon:yes gene_type:complete
MVVKDLTTFYNFKKEFGLIGPRALYSILIERYERFVKKKLWRFK